jgi:PIN domain-containing protein
MKKKFPGHFTQSRVEIKKLWDSCVFVVDANILLNLYRYSDSTRNEFLHTLEAIKERLWLPHRAAEEFFANRLTVIGQQEKAYDETVQTIEALQQNLGNARQHPFVSGPTMKKVAQVFGLLKQELSENKKAHTKRITDDSIQASVAKIFSGQVGEPYHSERLDEIFKEGESRYEERIPPGFKDAGKGSGSSTRTDCGRKYGDLLVWFQILEHARDESVSIILVTDDKKEDWWQTFNGKTVGPHPQLVQEFLFKTQQAFHMYQADRFLEFATEHLKQTIADTTLSEIREMRRRDIEAHHLELQRREREINRHEEYEALSNRISALRESHSSIENRRNELVYALGLVQDNEAECANAFEPGDHSLALTHEIQTLEAQLAGVNEELRNTEEEGLRFRRTRDSRRGSVVARSERMRALRAHRRTSE